MAFKKIDVDLYLDTETGKVGSVRKMKSGKVILIDDKDKIEQFKNKKQSNIRNKTINEKELSNFVKEYYKTHPKAGSCVEVAELIKQRFGLDIVSGAYYKDMREINTHDVNIHNEIIYDCSSDSQYDNNIGEIRKYKKIFNDGKSNYFSNKEIKDIKTFYDIFEKKNNDSDMILFVERERK